VAWSPSGLWLASGGTDTVVKVWSVVQKTPRQLLGHTDTVNAVAWSPNEKRIATASKDGTLRIWTVADGQTERVMKCGSTPLCVAWSPDGRYVACGSHPGGVQLWDADSGSRVREAGSSGATIVAVQWTSDSRHLIAVSGWAAGKPDAVHQYGVPELKDERVIGQLVDTIGAAALSPDGVNLAVGTRTHGIRILRVADGATVASLEEPRISARVVAWGPNGNELAVAGTDFSIRVWDLHSGRISRNLKGHADRV
jgi:WD40 repeat protein